MRQGQPKKFGTKRRGDSFSDGNQPGMSHASGHVGRNSGTSLLAGPIRFFSGIRKLYVALKYQMFRFTGGLLGRGAFPWLKVLILGIALFFLLKKDLQFTINLGKLSDRVEKQEKAKERPQVGEMGVGKSLTMKKTSSLSNRAHQPAGVDQLDEQEVRTYINRFAKVAEMEMKKFGIPASIKMAQGIIESWAGTHTVATAENNHFGDAMEEMAYNTSWENWRAHSVLLQRNYPELFDHGTDYRKWAAGLKKADYSEDRAYDKKLIEVIERFELYRLDE